MLVPYEAILLVSFGGPETAAEVTPFLENVLRGRDVPRERMLEVAGHYHHCGGGSPINAQNRALRAALEAELGGRGPRLPVFWGNRNWHPFLADTLREMAARGIRRALGFVTSAYSSYSGCRQYREDIARAQQEVGPGAPEIDKLRVFYNHPGFILPMIERARNALEQVPAGRRPSAGLFHTAHSIPVAMAETSRYVEQLQEACRLVSEGLGRGNYRLVFQSRSGPPSQPWLGPDIKDALREWRAAGESRDVVVVPIGFLSDHIEVLYDLDTDARKLCEQLGLNMVRADTVGVDPQFVSMIRELILERMEERPVRRSLGGHGPSHDICPVDCCPAGKR